MMGDRIIVGEIRGSEAIDMLQAMNTGHDGSLSTGHANSPEDMLSRIETMVLMGMELPLEAVERQIASGIDVIVHLARMRDKSRKIVRIDEVSGYINGRIVLKPIFERENDRLNKVGSLEHTEKLLAAGFKEEMNEESA